MENIGKRDITREVINRYIDIYKRTGISHAKRFIASVLLKDSSGMFEVHNKIVANNRLFSA